MSVEEKLVEAQRLQCTGENEAAIEELATALELCIARHGEHHLVCAPVYVEYAKALLRKAQAEGNPFGTSVCGKKGEDPSSSSDAGAYPGDSGADAQHTAAAGDEGEDASDEGQETEEAQRADGGKGGEESDDAEEAGDDEPEADDLELSFQCFEVARSIYEKEGEQEAVALAEVLELLGEVQMENEMWQEAIGDFERSITIKARLLAPEDRQLAHLHYQIATSAVALMESVQQGTGQLGPGPNSPSPQADAEAEAAHRAQARDHFAAAAEVLDLALKALLPSTNGQGKRSEEHMEVSELLAEVRAKVEEYSEPAPACVRMPQGTSEGVTTIGFGATTEGTTTIGFASTTNTSTEASLPVKNLGVVGSVSGRKKAVLELPCANDGAPMAEAMAPPARKRVRLEVAEAE